MFATALALAIDTAKRGGIAKPSVASLIAGVNRLDQGWLPYSRCASSRTRSVPGVPIERPLRIAVGAGVVWSVADFHCRY